MTAKRERPFSYGSQYMDWEHNNCCKCKKNWRYASDGAPMDFDNPRKDQTPLCDIQGALDDGRWGDGTVSREIAERMGYLDNSPPRQKGFSYVWQCKEFLPEEKEP